MARALPLKVVAVYKVLSLWLPWHRHPEIILWWTSSAVLTVVLHVSVAHPYRDPVTWSTIHMDNVSLKVSSSMRPCTTTRPICCHLITHRERCDYPIRSTSTVIPLRSLCLPEHHRCYLPTSVAQVQIPTRTTLQHRRHRPLFRTNTRHSFEPFWPLSSSLAHFIVSRECSIKFLPLRTPK